MLLKRLTEAAGIPGQEAEIRNVIRAEVTGIADEVRTDALGNLIAYKAARKTGDRRPLDVPRVMLAAHMDEVGLMILSIEKSGLLKFGTVGGVDARVLVSKTVLIGPNKIPGVIGAKPIHLQEPEERTRPIKVESMFIDIGAKSKEEAEKRVKIGDFAMFDTKFEEIGRNVVKGKAFDDRAGCAVLIEALRGDYGFDLYAVFTVQEEVGLRGSGVAAFDINPDIALALEGTTAFDVADTPEHGHSTSMGNGPAITFMDASVISTKGIVRRLLDVAQKEGIPTQFKRTVTGGTDAGRINTTREGIPAATVAVPCRYIHSPVSLVSLDDYQNTVRLVKGFLRSIDEGGLPA